MSLPTIEPLPDENASLPPARRRRQRRMIVPPGDGDKADFLRELANRTVPDFDFFLFSVLAGLVFGLALLLDAPALAILAALLAPFMAPVPGIALGTITGAVRFTLQSLGSLSIGSLIVFLCGALAGWAVDLLPETTHLQAGFHTHFTWPDFAVLTLGAGLTAYLIVRAPQQKPLVTSVAVAYSLYLPVGTAGFGLTSGISGLWPDGLILFLIHLVWAALVGTLVLSFIGLRPLNAAGYALGATYAVVSAAALLVVAGLSQTAGLLPVVTPTAEVAVVDALDTTPTPPMPTSISPAPTFTPTATQTRTLVPTRTVTMTITPVPTPVWARISASQGNGALIREEPNYEATVVQSLLNDSLVEVLNDVVTNGGSTWVHVRTVNGKEGWIVRSLLRTATPAPGW